MATGLVSTPEAIEDIRQGKAPPHDLLFNFQGLSGMLRPYNGSVKGNTRSYGIYCQAWDQYVIFLKFGINLIFHKLRDQTEFYHFQSQTQIFHGSPIDISRFLTQIHHLNKS